MSKILEAATCLAINMGNALNNVADAIRENARATELLARATAGEFSEQDCGEMPEAGSLSEVR